MLENIKSLYFIKLIFSFVHEGSKLAIANYNKNLQNKLGLKLLNYKIFAGRYIIYDSNGKGKEYNYEDELIFEGEYLNGKRNGKGKEYFYNGDIIFEGEYLNGKRNGKGKEYYNCSNSIKYEGEYLNGKRHGKGKINDNLDCEYLNGKEIEKFYDKNGNILDLKNI